MTENRHIYPLGATFDGKGTNFALFSSGAQKVELCLFDEKGLNETSRIEIKENDCNIWHIYLEGIKPGQIYGYRVYGEYNPSEGKRFNPNKLLIDPYAKKLVGEIVWNKAIFGYDIDSPDQDLSFSELDSAPYVPKSVVTEENFDWQGDIRPNVSFEDTIIYELHTKGYTKLFPDIKGQQRGKFAGLSSDEIMAYFKWLGITSIELLPIQAFFGHQKKRKRVNYWGYETLSFFALENSYLTNNDPNSFKQMVKRLHQNGQEVILDVVYNHTIEGNHLGPTLCYRGIDNESYYTLDKTNKRFYYDSTGCGASFNLQNENVLMLVMDSLRYFVQEMHVDGFRFDLASTLSREETEFKHNGTFFKTLQQDEVLRTVKLIMEPWDIGNNGYQIGSFPTGVAEWNDRFRDVTRRFWRGDESQTGEFASRLAGSSDIFGHHNRNIWSSINFITAHDGFCLNDLVSYNQKHNESNGENNKDGSNDNWSSNSGVEGITLSKSILNKRLKRARNLMSTLLFSFGTPMISAGDEFLRTQFGNNNPYAQDNIISYLAWDAVKPENYKFANFVKTLIELRHEMPIFKRRHFFDGQKVEGTNYKDLSWYNEKGVEFTTSDWQNPSRKSLSFLAFDGKDFLYMIFNASSKKIEWKLPALKKMKQWELLFDTSLSIKADKIENTDSIIVPAECIIAIKIGR
ncbi:MAG: glycogen debranching protein GlgX [Alphaproteobacteria bacterium]|nr:glycogen debranching protein GlgX [Alphaproteobacteria bacterium]